MSCMAASHIPRSTGHAVLDGLMGPHTGVYPFWLKPSVTSPFSMELSFFGNERNYHRVLLDKGFVLEQIQILVKSNSFQIMNWKCRYAGGCSFGCVSLIHPLGFPGGASGKEPACQSRRCKRHKFYPWVRKIPWRRAWQPTPVFLPGESHGERSLAGYSP